METERGTTQEFNRFPFVRDLHEIQPVFPEADFGLGITSGLLVNHPESGSLGYSAHLKRSVSESAVLQHSGRPPAILIDTSTLPRLVE